MGRRTRILTAVGGVAVVAAGVGVWLLWPESPRLGTATFDHDRVVVAIAFGPDGRGLAGGEVAGSERNAVIRIWDYGNGSTSGTVAVGDVGSAMAWSPDGTRFATGGYQTRVRLWDRATGLSTEFNDGPTSVYALAFSPDGRLLAAGGDGGVRLYDATTGAAASTLDGPATIVYALAFSPDGRLLASGASDGLVRLWDPATGRSTASLGAGARWVGSVAFSPDGKLLVVGEDGGRVRLWNLETKREAAVLQGDERTVASVAVSPDGRTVAAVGASSGDPKTDNDVMVRLWTVPDGELVESFPVGGLDAHGDRCSADVMVDTVLAFSPDGTALAASCGSAVRLWRLVS